MACTWRKRTSRGRDQAARVAVGRRALRLPAGYHHRAARRSRGHEQRAAGAVEDRIRGTLAVTVHSCNSTPIPTRMSASRGWCTRRATAPISRSASCMARCGGSIRSCAARRRSRFPSRCAALARCRWRRWSAPAASAGFACWLTINLAPDQRSAYVPDRRVPRWGMKRPPSSQISTAASSLDRCIAPVAVQGLAEADREPLREQLRRGAAAPERDRRSSRPSTSPRRPGTCSTVSSARS